VSRLTESNLPVVYGVGANICTRDARKRAIQHWYWHAATESQWTERNLTPPTIDAAGTPRKRCEGESFRERPSLQREECSLPATPPQNYPSRRHYAATHSNSSSLKRPQLHRPAPPQWEKWEPLPLRRNQHKVPSQSVQAPNVNSSYAKETLKVVATIFQ
jgi:hypothetical protein